MKPGLPLALLNQLALAKLTVALQIIIFYVEEVSTLSMLCKSSIFSGVFYLSFEFSLQLDEICMFGEKFHHEMFSINTGNIFLYFRQMWI